MTFLCLLQDLGEARTPSAPRFLHLWSSIFVLPDSLKKDHVFILKFNNISLKSFCLRLLSLTWFSSLKAFPHHKVLNWTETCLHRTLDTGCCTLAVYHQENLRANFLHSELLGFIEKVSQVFERLMADFTTTVLLPCNS